MYGDLATLLGVLLLVLVGFTLMCEVLTHQFANHDRIKLITNVYDRIKAWWVMAVIILFMAVTGKTGVIIVSLFCAFAALREFLTLTNTRLADTWALGTAFFCVLPVQFLAVVMGWSDFYALFIPVYAFLCMPILAALRGEVSSFLVRVAETQWSLMVAVFCISHIPALLNFDIAGYAGKNLLLIVFLIIIAQSSDTMQYVFGQFWGKRLVAAQLSDVKTWEGFAASVVGSAILGVFLFWITPFGPIGAAAFAVAICISGFAGGLVMSAIKRDRGVRDFGPMMRAQGGFIDRLDTVVFSAPVMYYLMQVFWG